MTALIRTRVSKRLICITYSAARVSCWNGPSTAVPGSICLSRNFKQAARLCILSGSIEYYGGGDKIEGGASFATVIRMGLLKAPPLRLEKIVINDRTARIFIYNS